jgi:hypothetical protein
MDSCYVRYFLIGFIGFGMDGCSAGMRMGRYWRKFLCMRIVVIFSACYGAQIFLMFCELYQKSEKEGHYQLIGPA